MIYPSQMNIRGLTHRVEALREEIPEDPFTAYIRETTRVVMVRARQNSQEEEVSGWAQHCYDKARKVGWQEVQSL